MTEIPPEIMKAAPGAAGSFVSMLFMKADWKRRIALFLAGAALAFYGTPWVSANVIRDAGFAGFLLGCFGMAIVARLWEAWDGLELTSILRDAIRKLLGLPAKES